MAKELELGGLAPVAAADGKSIETLAQEYARVAMELSGLRNA